MSRILECKNIKDEFKNIDKKKKNLGYPVQVNKNLQTHINT